MESTSASDALGSLSSNWMYILVAVLALVAGYFIYKRYYSSPTVSYAAPLSAQAQGAAAPAAKKEAEVEEYETEDEKEE